MSNSRARRGPFRRPRAIVTGGAGFIGSHLVDRLLAEGLDVLVVDDLSTGWPQNVAAQARLEQLDIATAELERLFRAWHPGVVFHLAAQASVPLSVRDPLRDLAVNVVGTHRVSAAARAAGAVRLVFVSSGGAIYGETARRASEQTRPAPSSYYGIHKLAAEGHAGLAGLPCVIARPSNVYGPRQAAGLEGAVVAAFLDQARQQGSLRIHGDGCQTRDFVHVRDAVGALWKLGQAESPPGIWNVASGSGITIRDLAEVVEHSIGRRLGREFGARRPGDITQSAISSRRLRGLGWRPIIELSAGIAELVEMPVLEAPAGTHLMAANREGPNDRGQPSDTR
jgi:UDP-glucose 4-epimerase